MSSVQVMIPPKSGYALRVGSGQVVRIIDVEGMQVADVVAYDATDPSDHLSRAFTRANNDSAALHGRRSALLEPERAAAHRGRGQRGRARHPLPPVAGSSMSTSSGSRARRAAATPGRCACALRDRLRGGDRSVQRLHERLVETRSPADLRARVAPRRPRRPACRARPDRRRLRLRL